eukprot:422645-Prymnesium_polylepis.3
MHNVWRPLRHGHAAALRRLQECGTRGIAGDDAATRSFLVHELLARMESRYEDVLQCIDAHHTRGWLLFVAMLLLVALQGVQHINESKPFTTAELQSGMCSV